MSCSAVGPAGRWKMKLLIPLKKGGYGLDHNYGHGKENLSVNVLLMMMLSFLVDQIFEMKNDLLNKARQAYKYKSYLWEKIREAYQWRYFASWEELLECLIKKKNKPLLDTS